MRRLTASGLDLAAACPGAFVLDGIEDTSPAAELGTEVHRQIAEWVNGPAGCPLPTIPQARVAVHWLCHYDGYLAAQAARAEVAYALDPATGEVRELGAGGGRDYSAAPAGWICGTVDLVAVRGGADHRPREEPAEVEPPEVLVLDWKTGGSDRGAPGRSLQLLFGAYCAAAAQLWPGVRSEAFYGEALRQLGIKARVVFAYVSEDDVDAREATIEPADWPGVLERLRAVAASVEAARAGGLQVRTGEHCSRCPALLACPATRQAVRLLDPITIVDDPAEMVAAASPRAVAAALSSWRHLKKIGDAVEERAKLLAREGLLPGWRLVQRQRQELHGGTAHGTLRDLHGEQVAREGVEISTTKKLVKDALRAHLARLAEAGQPQPRGTLAKLEREALRLIAERGGAETRTYETLTEDIQEALCAPEEA